MSETPWRVCPEHGEYKRFWDGGCLKCGMVGVRVDEVERIRDAAPDLLEALELIVKRTPYDGQGYMGLDAWNAARAAIAKARGGKT